MNKDSKVERKLEYGITAVVGKMLVMRYIACVGHALDLHKTGSISFLSLYCYPCPFIASLCK